LIKSLNYSDHFKVTVSNPQDALSVTFNNGTFADTSLQASTMMMMTVMMRMRMMMMRRMMIVINT
jgi:hypothetical protein